MKNTLLFTRGLAFVAFIVLIMMPGLGWGQTTFSWNFGTSSSNAATSSGSLANLTVGNVSIGNTNGTVTMLSTTSASSGYAGSSGQFNAGNAARIGALNTGANGSAYFEFTLTPEIGYTVSLSSISFGTRCTSTAPQAYTLRSSSDSYASDIATGSISANSSWQLKSNPSLTFSGTSGTPVTFRLYGYNGGGSASANTINWRIDDLSIDVNLSGGSTPTIAVTPTSLTGFSYVQGFGPSTSQTYSLSASNLTPADDKLTVTSSTNYVVSTNGSDYYPSIKINYTGGTVSATTIYVRLKEGLSTGNYNSENVTNSGGGATTANVVCSGSVTAPPSPVITVSASSLSGFGYVFGAGPSTAQSFNVSGSDMTANLVIDGTTNYEISESAGSGYTSQITLTPSGNAVPSTPIYVRLVSGLTVGAYNSQNIYLNTTGATQKNVTCNGNVFATEPTNHATAFTAITGTPTHSAIIVGWTDATGGVIPDGYLIKGSSVSYGSISDPTDGISEADGGLVKNIAKETEIHEFTSLTPNTAYYFKIYPYTNSGSNINYKTDPTIPQTTATTDAQPVTTYTWNVASGNWNTASSWTPNRTVPAASDILIFDGLTQNSPSVTLDFSTPQSIGRLRIINNANATFSTSSSSRTLEIGYTGLAAPHLEISSGSSLVVSAGNKLTINVLSGFTGSISGSISFSNAAHILSAVDANGITFNNGSSFTAGSGFTGSAFGNTNLNSIIFANGSTYISQAGANPFGAAAPNSVVIFQTGSTYKQKLNNAPALNGRTYANFEIDFATFSQNLTGSSGVTMDNLVLTNCTSLGMNLTGAMNIKGNILVNNGTLSFSPSSSTNINLNGSSPQTISGNGTFTSNNNANFIIDNAVIADKNITFGSTVNINAGKSFTINAGKQITVNSTLTNSAGTSGLVIKSNASGTGSLIHSTAGVNATIERYITGAPEQANASQYHLVSYPFRANYLSSEWTGSYLFDLSEASGQWGAVGANPNYQCYSTKGYLLYYPAASTTYTHTGVLKEDACTFPVTRTGASAYPGFNVLPNPYPCALDFNVGAAWSSNIQDSKIWCWSASSGNYGAFIRSGSGTLGVTNIIPVGQAFFVQATASGDVTIATTAKTHSSQAYYKTTEATSNLLRLKTSANTFADEIIVQFRPDATTGYDAAMEAIKMTGQQEAPQLSATSADGENLSINALPFSSEDVIVPLNFSLVPAGEVTFTASGLESFESSLPMYLEDLAQSKVINLREQANYTFSHSGGDAGQRFQLRFKGVNNTPDQPTATEGSVFVSQGYLYIEVPSMQQTTVRVRVYDALGREFSEGKYTHSGLLQLPAPTATGVYVVRVQSGNKVFTAKVVVK